MAEDKSEYIVPPGEVITGDPVIEDLPDRPLYDTPKPTSTPSKSDDAKTAMIIDTKSDKTVHANYGEYTANSLTDEQVKRATDVATKLTNTSVNNEGKPQK